MRSGACFLNAGIRREWKYDRIASDLPRFLHFFILFFTFAGNNASFGNVSKVDLRLFGRMALKKSNNE
jgi:hypothetical protein